MVKHSGSYNGWNTFGQSRQRGCSENWNTFVRNMTTINCTYWQLKPISHHHEHHKSSVQSVSWPPLRLSIIAIFIIWAPRSLCAPQVSSSLTALERQRWGWVWAFAITNGHWPWPWPQVYREACCHPCRINEGEEFTISWVGGEQEVKQYYDKP